jgi:hypothetical protein
VGIPRMSAKITDAPTPTSTLAQTGKLKVRVEMA